MSVPLQSHHQPSDLVARLRAAGCVYAEDEATLLLDAAHDPDDLARLTARRIAGEPLEHVLGWVEFHGRRIGVGPGVFVPRRRTELVVREGVRAVPHAKVVLDLCCGSAALGVVAASELGEIELIAVDIDAAAVACARDNVAGFRATVLQGDLYAPLPAGLRGEVDLILANAPYVPTGRIGQLPPEARSHEPRVALDGGRDGLNVLRRVLRDAPDWLAPEGHVVVESSASQCDDLAAAAEESGLVVSVVRAEELGATVVVGRRSAPFER